MPYKDPEKLKAYRKEYYKKNREVVRARAKKWEEDNPERVKERKKVYYKKNKKQIAERARKYQLKHREEATARFKKYKDKNPEKVRANARAWARRNREKVTEQQRKRDATVEGKARRCFHNSRRRQGVKERTPPWVDHDAIKRIYKEAKEWEGTFGGKYHVDHIIPLHGETVSGLHVAENLQILEAGTNASKCNRYDL